MDSESHKEKKITEGFVGQRMFVLPPDVRESLNRNALVQNLFLTAIGFYPHASFHDRIRKEGSLEYIFLYCIKGEGEVRINNKNLKISPNTYVIIPPLVAHHYKSSLENPWSIYWMHFSGNSADLLYKRYYDGIEPEVKSIPFEEQRLKDIDNMMNLLEENLTERNLEVVNIILLHFLSSFIYNFNPINSLKTDSIRESMDYMRKNLDKILRIQELASQQNLSVSRYSKLFREKTGLSPVKYFIQMKIQKSCQYLYFTDLSIKEICCKVGFDDPYYFSRMFKKLMGIAPSKYKAGYIKIRS